jgi:hypothetical protein
MSINYHLQIKGDEKMVTTEITKIGNDNDVNYLTIDQIVYLLKRNCVIDYYEWRIEDQDFLPNYHYCILKRIEGTLAIAYLGFNHIIKGGKYRFIVAPHLVSTSNSNPEFYSRLTDDEFPETFGCNPEDIEDTIKKVFEIGILDRHDYWNSKNE